MILIEISDDESNNKEYEIQINNNKKQKLNSSNDIGSKSNIKLINPNSSNSTYTNNSNHITSSTTNDREIDLKSRIRKIKNEESTSNDSGNKKPNHESTNYLSKQVQVKQEYSTNVGNDKKRIIRKRRKIKNAVNSSSTDSISNSFKFFLTSSSNLD